MINKTRRRKKGKMENKGKKKKERKGKYRNWIVLTSDRLCSVERILRKKKREREKGKIERERNLILSTFC